MGNKKYELTTDSKVVFGKKVFRIKALISFGNVAAGDLGGYVEKEENLSHDGNAWVYGDAKVCGNALVCGNAVVYGNAEVYGDAVVYGNAKVRGNAVVCGNAVVRGNAVVCGNAKVCDSAVVRGNAKVCDSAVVCGNAVVYGNADYLCFKGLGSQNRNTTFFRCKDGHIHVSCGCFSGNLDEFESKVKETHGESKFAKEYLSCIETVKIHFEVV